MKTINSNSLIIKISMFIYLLVILFSISFKTIADEIKLNMEVNNKLINAPQLRLSDKDRNAIAQEQPIDVIIEFDQTEVIKMAEAKRRQGGLDYDDDSILSERKQRYQTIKNQVLTVMSAEHLTIKQDYDYLPIIFAKIHSSNSLRMLLKQSSVIAVSSTRKFTRFLTESLPLIRQPETAVQGGRGNGVTIAILDSGLDYTLPAFGRCSSPGNPSTCKVAYVRDFAPYDGVLDDDGHGTNVAAIALGVAPGARIIGLDIFDS